MTEVRCSSVSDPHDVLGGPLMFTSSSVAQFFSNRGGPNYYVGMEVDRSEGILEPQFSCPHPVILICTNIPMDG